MLRSVLKIAGRISTMGTEEHRTAHHWIVFAWCSSNVDDASESPPIGVDTQLNRVLFNTQTSR